jgi:hypothetical protein
VGKGEGEAEEVMISAGTRQRHFTETEKKLDRMKLPF